MPNRQLIEESADIKRPIKGVPLSMRTSDQVAGMPCPVCKTPLALSDRQGIEIDYCPQCRGVWLDRGELDKIIERDAAQNHTAPAQSTQIQQPPHMPTQQPYAAHPSYGHSDQRYYKNKRKKHWLEDLFD